MFWFIIVILLVDKFYQPVFISIYEYVFFNKLLDFFSITTVVAVVVVWIPPLYYLFYVIPLTSSSPPIHEQY